MLAWLSVERMTAERGIRLWNFLIERNPTMHPTGRMPWPDSGIRQDNLI